MKKNKIIMQGIALAMSVFVAGTAIDMSTDFSKTFAEAREQEEYSFVTDNGKKSQYIVQVDNEKAYRTLEQNSKAKEVYDQSNNIKLKSNQVMVLDVSAKEANQIKQMEGVNVLEKDHTLTADELVPVDENQVEKAINENKEMPVSQWNLEAVNAPKQENIDVTTASAVKVAVLDSGVSDLSGIDVKERVDFAHMGQKYVNENPMFDDPCGHGTGIAGVIAGKKGTGSLWGIAQDAEIYSVKVLNEKNETTVSKVVSGIYWCIDHGMDVINMSFGTQTNSEMLKKAIDDAKAAGIILVAAAGNQGDSAKKMDYPAAYDGVISVGAINGKMQICDFTSDKEKVDIYAPGEKVWTHGVLQGITPVDGTSIAAAHVTGAVSLLLQTNSNADYEFIKQLLQFSASTIAKNCKEGILNISKAIIREKNYKVQNTNEKVVPANFDIPQSYDTNNIITGCWSSKRHGELVGATGSSTRYMIMAATASLVDTCFPSNNDYAFHGKDNYVANLHFLYEVAKATSYTKLNYRPENASQGLGVASVFLADIAKKIVHSKDIRCGARDIDRMARALEVSITGEGNDIRSAVGAVDCSDVQWMIMGYAVHLLGDIFAHRTMVPTQASFEAKKTSTNFKKSDFNSDMLSEIKKQIKNNNIEFRDIQHYTTNKKPSWYEDNVDFYPNRYKASGNAVYKLIRAFESRTLFNPIAVMTKGVGFQMKLNNFKGYTNSAGYNGNEVTSYSTSSFRVNAMKKDGILQPMSNEIDCYDYGY